jgi:Putative beta-barrel porin-2, OmpL-like. bbp2
MRKQLGILFAGMFLVGLAGAALADDTSSNGGPHFTFGASTSYVYDFNKPDTGADSTVNALSYANMEPQDEAFNIDLVQVGITGSRGRASYGAKLDYGDLTSLAGDDINGDIALQTAFLSYDFGGASATVGRFDTPIGYEVLEPWGNANISRSYSWSLLQPINHDGIFMSGNVGVIDAMLGVTNGFTVADNNISNFNELDDEKGVVGAVGAAISDAVNLYFASIYTEDSDVVDKQLYNAIISGKVPANGSTFRYALEANYRNDDNDEGNRLIPPRFPGDTREGEVRSWSLVGYTGADFGPCSLDLRGEYIDIHHQLSGFRDFSTGSPGTGAESLVLNLDPTDPGSDWNSGPSHDKVWSVTATAGWYITDGLQFRLEYRHDQTRGRNFDNEFGDGSSGDKADNTLQAQVVWYPEL